MLGISFMHIHRKLFEIFKNYHKSVVKITAPTANRTIIGGPKNGEKVAASYTKVRSYI